MALSSSSEPHFLDPLSMISQHRSNIVPQPIPFALSIPSAESSTSSHLPVHHNTSESSQTTFKQRIRASLEHGLRTATRSRARATSPDDDFDTIRNRDRLYSDDIVKKDSDNEKAKSGMFERLEFKVGFRWAPRNSVTRPSTPTVSSADQSRVSIEHVNNAEMHGQSRVAGWTSFITPSLRQASVSSPAVHLSSPSPNSQPAAMVNSTSSATTASTARDRIRRTTMQPTIREISAPQPLLPRREHRNGPGSPERSGAASPRPGRSRLSPIFTPSSPSTQSFVGTSQQSSHLPSPPGSPTLGKGRMESVANKPGATSAAYLPFNSPPSPPTPSRAASPGHARTPARRVSPISHQGRASISTAHLPPTPPATSKRFSINARRPSIESVTRPLLDSSRRSSAESSRRSSTERPRRGSISMDTQWRSTTSSSPRPTSPSSTTRSRATSPMQRPSGHVHNRNFNVSVASLSSASTPEQRELIRSATSFLCRELRKPPPHLSRSQRARDWAEVEVRLQPLVRLERIWGKSRALSGANSSQIGAGFSSTVISNAGEERERKLFCEALKDGVVLCE